MVPSRDWTSIVIRQTEDYKAEDRQYIAQSRITLPDKTNLRLNAEYLGLGNPGDILYPIIERGLCYPCKVQGTNEHYWPSEHISMLIQHDEELGATITVIEGEAGKAVLNRPRPRPSFWEQVFTDLRNQIFSDSHPNFPNKREPPSPMSGDSNSTKKVPIRNLSGAIRRRRGVSGYTEIPEDEEDTRD